MEIHKANTVCPILLSVFESQTELASGVVSCKYLVFSRVVLISILVSGNASDTAENVGISICEYHSALIPYHIINKTVPSYFPVSVV